MSTEELQNRGITEFKQEIKGKNNFILTQETLEALIIGQTPVKIKRSDGSIVEGVVERSQRLGQGDFDLDNVSIVVKFFDSKKGKFGRKEVGGRLFLEWQENGMDNESELENSGAQKSIIKPDEIRVIVDSDKKEQGAVSIKLLNDSLEDLESKMRNFQGEMMKEWGVDSYGNHQTFWEKYKWSDYLKKRFKNRPEIGVGGGYVDKINVQIGRESLYFGHNNRLTEQQAVVLDSTIIKVQSFLSDARARLDKESKLLSELKKGESKNFVAKFWWLRFGEGKKIADQLPPKENRTSERGYYRGEDFIARQPTFLERLSDKPGEYFDAALDFVFPGREIYDALRKTEEKFFVEKFLVISTEHDLASLELVRDWGKK